ncbi:hypothetical protein CAEBREN_03715 [Caenorhabditis brenneri]|uniref:Up-regulated in Daf-2 domain-containing protein n=1 Tax=Caenorhabditis brenneri TaxID=135651 RepID=G0NIC3_CAEBE|nr:hypothetical protein CAEBREN_03715 [Caenorhabditis brenneri]
MSDQPYQKAPSDLFVNERKAKVSLMNGSNILFMARVCYQYTGQTPQFSKFMVIAPGEWVTAFDPITYWTGVGTSGQIQWKIQGIRLEESHSDNDLTIKYNGKAYTHGGLMQTNGGAWMTHNLWAGDEGRWIELTLGQPNGRISSPVIGSEDWPFTDA